MSLDSLPLAGVHRFVDMSSAVTHDAALWTAGALRARLGELSRDLWSTWSVDAARVWDAVLGALPAASRARRRRNPVLLVAKLAARQLTRLAGDDAFRALLVDAENAHRVAVRRRSPPFGLSSSAPVAYLSMEFGLHETLPIFAGGLGILAGDHIKSAGDAAVPLIGVSFLYRRGYFRQQIHASGRQQVVYPRADYRSMPVDAILDERGREMRVQVELPGRAVECRLWRLRVGSRDLVLLDTEVAENDAKDRAISEKLYIGDRTARISQEVVLGVGSVRALRALGVRPGVWHLNEGHVVFQALERLRELSTEHELDVASALEAVAADTVFTTHTPVPEGNEAFDLPLAERFLRPHCEAAGIAVEDFLRLGLDHDKNGRSFLSLTVLAMRLSRFRNGVSALHGEVSRRMWQKLWPGFTAGQVPITSVTNGIHVSTWVAPQFDAIYRERLGDDWAARVADPETWKPAKRIPDRTLWDTKRALRLELVEFVRERTRERLARCGHDEARRRRETQSLLDPDALTIGFARRFALYKRAGLLFRDIRRAARLFASKTRPVQIIFAGKPHPEDALGAELFENIASLSRRAGLRGKVVLLENYDTEVARYLVRGVDVWLNNPRRPQEASGTSGQKVPVNCGLNLSILDGWWCEGYSPGVGWDFGTAKDYDDPELQDREDHADLMRTLEREVVPLYYDRDRHGVPRRWMRRVKESLVRLVPRFSTQHMVLEYAERLYAPAYENGRWSRQSSYRAARELAAWRQGIERAWPLAHVRGVAPSSRGRERLDVEVYLAGIDAADIAFSDARGDLLEVDSVEALSSGAHAFRVEFVRGAGPLRLFPTHPELVHPQELGLSLAIEC